MHNRRFFFLSVLAFLIVFSPLSQVAHAPNYTSVTVQEAKTMIDSNPLLIILDVREQYEYDTGHIRNAVLIPLDKLANRTNELDKNKDILVYCRTGGRSVSASQTLVSKGFEHVYNMLGGITAWTAAGYPIYVRYSSIQEAINSATAGDTIRVSVGNYIETIIIDKSITLEGENKTTTVINGNYTNYRTITIEANNVCIRDFTIKNGYYAVFCLYPSLTNLTLQNNIIRDNNRVAGTGVALYGFRHTVRDNTITNNGYGILLGTGGNNTITQNTITNNFGSGVELRNTENNNITENYVLNNSVGIRFYTQSNTNTINKNIMVNCTIGISMHDSRWNQFSRNSVQNSTGLGFSLLQSHNNTIAENTISYSKDKALFIVDSSSNTIYHNNMVSNTAQLENRNSTNTWDNGFLEGNYWSNYNGTDTNQDGIGDTFLPWQNVDNFPLMNPYLDGDMNHDGTVNETDANMVINAWLSKTGDANYNPHVDVNMDGIINIVDATVVGFNWQKTFSVEGILFSRKYQFTD